jgi:hypothetical protein
MYYYDEGEYLGQLIPDSYPLKDYRIKVSCYLLRSGGFAWSFNSEVCDISEAQDYKLVKVPSPFNVEPFVSHIIYDDYHRMKKMRRTYSPQGLFNLFTKTKVRNIKFQ